MASVDRIVLTLLVLCVAVIGATDYLTGPDIGFSLFYLAPIVWGAWRIGAIAGLSVSVIAGLSWVGADVAWHGVTAVSLWNGFTRIGIFVSMAWLISRLKREQQSLHQLNEQLRVMLDHEQMLARTDALTGLPNRRLFVDELKRATAKSHRTNAPMTVAYVDLDHFKSFNDLRGRLAGDVVLRAIAEVVSTHTSGSGVAARLGSDEFALLFEHCPEEAASSLAAGLLADLTRVVSRLTHDSVGINIGVACFDRPPLSPEAVIDHADAAMYCAKARGKNSSYLTHLAAESVLAPS